MRKKPHDPPYQRGRTLSSLVTLELSSACPLWPRPCLAHPPPHAAHTLLVAPQHQLAAPGSCLPCLLWLTIPGPLSSFHHLPVSHNAPPPPQLWEGESPSGIGPTCLPALANWTRAGHMTPARPTQLGFGLKDPGRSPWEETGPLGWSLELPCGLQREGLEQG